MRPRTSRSRPRHQAVVMKKSLSFVDRCMPLPPMPGIEDRIVPLRSKTELLAEGRIQRNCVASYADRVVAGECYIYRVLHPNRATLSVSLQSAGNWEISELQASCNRPVDHITWKYVNEWLDLYHIGA